MSEENETKKCQYCGEEILATAKKCKHCGEYLENGYSTRIFSKQEIKQIRDKIQSLKLPEKFKNNKDLKEELSDATNRCESLFDSIVTPGYRPFYLTFSVIMFFIFIISVIVGISAGGFGGFFVGIIVCILINLLIYLYFLPSYTAFRNGHKQAWLILVINIFFASLILPWFIILIWALSNKNKEDIVNLEQSNRIRQEVLPMYEKIENKINKLCDD
ncbi:superinfection immunity protein [bacterium]|nr:superinfection immunity protein [bacterium]